MIRPEQGKRDTGLRATVSWHLGWSFYCSVSRDDGGRLVFADDAITRGVLRAGIGLGMVGIWIWLLRLPGAFPLQLVDILMAGVFFGGGATFAIAGILDFTRRMKVTFDAETRMVRFECRRVGRARVNGVGYDSMPIRVHPVSVSAPRSGTWDGFAVVFHDDAGVVVLACQPKLEYLTDMIEALRSDARFEAVHSPERIWCHARVF